MEIILNDGERIIAVVPEKVKGPGWSNEPTWVYIMKIDGGIREICIQPDERSEELNILFDAGSVICKALMDAVNKMAKSQIAGEHQH